MGVFSDAVNSDNISLVFNRSGLQQRHPMTDPLLGKIRNDNEKLGPMSGRCLSENFRESQIITNERGSRAVIPCEDNRTLPRDIVFRLSSRREWPHLGIEGDQFAGWREDERLVSSAAIASA